MRKIKTKIEWEFQPIDIPDIPIEIFQSFKPKIINKKIKIVKITKIRKQDASGNFTKLF